MLSALLGLLSAALPEFMNFGKQWLDHKQEKELLELRMKNAQSEHTWRMEAIEAQAWTEEVKAVRQPHESYGVKLLDRATQAAEGIFSRWVLNAVFLLFSLADLAITLVRPTVTYAFFGLYAAIKIATLTRLVEITESLSDALISEHLWTQTDAEIFMFVLAFWFGERRFRRARGER